MSAQHHAGDSHAPARVGVLTISDTRTLEDDEGGDLVVGLVKGAGHDVAWRWVVKDEARTIRQGLAEITAEGADVVIMSGGTGIARRDVTYEVVAPMLEKRLDGFGEAFRRLSWDQVGARSILSRAIAGTIGPTLVFALPGSPRGVRLALEQLILPVLPHAVGLLR